MIPASLEPKGLNPETPPLADYFAAGAYHADAINGSLRLCRAILRMGAPERKHKRKRNDKPDCFRPRNHCSRQLAKDKVLRIRAIAAEYFGLVDADMLSRRGKGSLPLYRQIAMYLARELTTASYVDIGTQFGGRDHTTVIHSCEVVAELVEYDLRVRSYVAVLREAITR